MPVQEIAIATFPGIVEILLGVAALSAGLAACILGRADRSHISSAELLLRLFRLGSEMHPAWTLRDLRWRAAILGLWLTSRGELRAWYGIADNPGLSAALGRFPQMHGAIYGPYIHRGWSMRRRLHAIDEHYRLLRGRAAILAFAAQREVELLPLEDRLPGLRLVLDKTEWFLREGEVVLNLFLGDRRVLSVAFTLGREPGQLVAYVGAVQGMHADNALQVYREITHALHHMRPRDLLLVALRQLCACFGVGRILAVSSEARQHNSAFFGDSHKHKVMLDYDEVWRDQGGAPIGDGFFEIPVAVRHREMSEIPSRKRSMYRRRYQMLDQLALDIGAACARHESAPPRAA